MLVSHLLGPNTGPPCRFLYRRCLDKPGLCLMPTCFQSAPWLYRDYRICMFPHYPSHILMQTFLFEVRWRHRVPSSKYPVANTWRQVLGIKYLVPSSWFHDSIPNPMSKLVSGRVLVSYQWDSYLLGPNTVPPCRFLYRRCLDKPGFCLYQHVFNQRLWVY